MNPPTHSDRSVKSASASANELVAKSDANITLVSAQQISKQTSQENIPGENVAITIKNKGDKLQQNTVAGENVAITIKIKDNIKLDEKQRSIDKDDEQELCYVRNSSFLSRDIEARASNSKSKESPKTASPKKVKESPQNEILQQRSSPPKKEPPPQSVSPPKGVVSPPVSTFKLDRSDSKGEESTVAMIASKLEAAAPQKQEVKEVLSPPVGKLNRSDSKVAENIFPPKLPKRENSIKETASKIEKLSLGVDNNKNENNSNKNGRSNLTTKVDHETTKNDESNGVGDKIKKFEKAAEDASGTVGRLSRAGSYRGRSLTERLTSDGKEDFPPPATPFKDNVHFDLSTEKTEPINSNIRERQQSITKNSTSNTVKWQRSESHDEKIQKPEPQKIIKPEFKPMPSPVDVTIRSPSLGAKILDQFPSHGTAFRNVASPDQARNIHKLNEDVNTQNNVKPCKIKKEKYSASVSKGSSYFTRGSEEIWLVKKKDIEEIEERVLDSFRRAGGNICMRSESTRPASDSGQGASFTHATMGRNKRQMYARSESLDPQWAGNRAQTLKRQTSVACTCGHDKKPRARSAGADAVASAASGTSQRPRARSHAEDSQHVLDKYETLV